MSENNQSVIARLKAGNLRFINNQSVMTTIDKSKMATPQKPFAIILGCSDSRVPVEMIFDEGIGELFVVRVAGNVASCEGIGSIEFAVEQFDVPFILVLGHTQCGAVNACIDCVKAKIKPDSDNLSAVVEKVRVGIAETVENNQKQVSVCELTQSNQAIDANIKHNVLALTQNSNVLKSKVDARELQIVGAKFVLETGNVEFF